MWSGEPLPTGTETSLRNEIGELHRGGDLQTDRLLLRFHFSGPKPFVMAWRVVARPESGRPAVVGLIADPSLANQIFARIVKHSQLLPPSLAGDTHDLLSVRVLSPDGHEIFSSSNVWSQYMSETSLDRDLGDLRIGVALTGPAAERLIIGGLPRNRVPLLIVLLAITTGLIALSFVQLHARADVPGVDFSDNYELPVFRTQASAVAEAAAAEPFGGPSVNSAAQPDEESPAPAPVKTHIVYREDERGISFYFPPLRNHAQALGVVAFAIIWSAVVYLLWTNEHAAWFFRIVFSLFEILVGYMLLNAVFGSASICVREGALQIRKAILGIGSLQQIALSEVVSVLPLSQGQANASGEVLYGITVKKSDSREIKVAANSLSTVEARWVVSTLEHAMGRRQDTRVQLQPMYGAPPQRSRFAGAGQVNVPLRLNRLPRFVGAAGLVVWLFFMGSMFYRGFSHSAVKRMTGPSSTSSSRPAIPDTPMTDADVSRISALPPQQQAEELLARSIGYDERALELFEGRIEGWTSDVRLTDRMKQLDAQASYSTDLRVRQADAGLWLAMEGWRQNQEAVDALLQRAEQDKQYCPTAYYMLGIEASRGIDTAHVFAVLHDRALNDPDPLVRQWAVEGLRFFKTDDALDVLYQSFTKDASYAVRDRAGCNVSDCGIFTRTQRMRLVPRLIELADDPNLTPRMRNWVFMALNGNRCVPTG